MAGQNLRVPRAIGDYLILRALRESRGTAVAVSDAELLSAQRELGALQGLLAAPEGAAGWAGIKKLFAQGVLSPDERIVLFNTASGIKMPELLPQGLPVFDLDDPRAMAAVA